MKAVRVFLSFDAVHDRDLNDELLAQADERSIFAIAACSEAGPVTDVWSRRARSRIVASDEVVVLCGAHTDSSPQMSAELRIAQEEKKPYVLVWGRREQMCKKPKGARSGDVMYRWSAEIIEDQILAAFASNRKPVCRRP